MDRRGFLKLFGGAVAGIAIDQAIPLGRVWSFPKEIAIAPTGNLFLVSMEVLRRLQYNLIVAEGYFNTDWEKDFKKDLLIGSIMPIRFPQHYSRSGSAST